MAMLMASIMVVVALAAFVTPDQTDGREGDVNTPKYIIGGTDDTYELETGKDVTAKIDFNYKAYDSLSTPVFTASIQGSNATPVTISSTATAVGEHVKIAINAVSGTTGIYEVTATGVSIGTNAETFVINMAVTDTVWTDKTVDLDYNYAMNIKVVSAPTSGIALQNGTTDVSTTPLDIQLGKDFYGTFAKLKVGDSYLGSDKYDFYTTGLPAGIYMKSTGEIAGKVISTENVTTSAKSFTVYAVDVATGEKLFDKSFTYTISLASDSFQYEIDDGDDENEHVYVPYTTPGYTAVRNYDTNNKIKVNVVSGTEEQTVENQQVLVPKAADLRDTTKYKVSYTLSDNSGAAIIDVTGENLQLGYFTLPANTFDNYTGVVEITIQDIVNGYKAIIHVMVVGPVVHSGLAPAVTSA